MRSYLRNVVPQKAVIFPNHAAPMSERKHCTFEAFYCRWHELQRVSLYVIDRGAWNRWTLLNGRTHTFKYRGYPFLYTNTVWYAVRGNYGLPVDEGRAVWKRIELNINSRQKLSVINFWRKQWSKPTAAVWLIVEKSKHVCAVVVKGRDTFPSKVYLSLVYLSLSHRYPCSPNYIFTDTRFRQISFCCTTH